MRGILRGVDVHHCEPLSSAWEFRSTPANSVASPDGLSPDGWLPTRVPTTAAASLRELGRWSLSSRDDGVRRFDADDWWFRCQFAAPAPAPGETLVLHFDGLATVAEVWLNGAQVLVSDNMFVAHEVHLPALAGRNEVVIRCRALDTALKAKRPRPRWKAPMIENQQIRWFRTTLLGRTPGWSPPAAAVGPWRDVWLERRRDFTLADLRVRTSVVDGAGRVDLAATLTPSSGRLTAARLVLERGDQVHSAAVAFGGDHRATARLEVPSPALWWPHTHGEPALHDARLEVDLETAVGPRTATARLAPVGFRSVEVARERGGFELRVNGERIFCRGACWTPLDVVTLTASRDEYARVLSEVRAAGMNMLRIGGTMVYESDDFLELCDEYGILVWQDLMFANMDYPDADAAFVAGVRTELSQQLERLLPHAAVAVICGNSEVEQQAAMWGAPRERWQPHLFHEIVPALLAELDSRTPYWPSSAHGGSFPHQPSQGTTSYYGVGAYLRPLDDARRSDVRFATEALGFANVPEDATIAAMPGGLGLRVHHPDWKLRAPRDLGAGWDFDDVRDFYLKTLFDVDPLQLRYADHDRYLRFSRVVTGEVMASTFTEWRRAGSACSGALVWFLRDLWEGAGWGLIDALGEPKSAWHGLRRVLQPQMLAISDEGNNGLALHVVNDSPSELDATLTLTLYRGGEAVVAQGRRDIRVDARGATTLQAGDLFDSFHDLSWAYRFGPPSYDVALATLERADSAPFAFATHFPAGLAVRETRDLGLQAVATPSGEGYELRLKSRAFARWVSVQADGFVCDDQYFHLPPGMVRVLRLSPRPGVTPRGLRGQVEALNGSSPVTIEPGA
jgi:beta-mannosidase